MSVLLGESVTEHPAYVELARVVSEVIAPAAVEVDAGEVPGSHLEALGETGFWGWSTPEEHGGSPVPPEVLCSSSACCSW